MADTWAASLAKMGRRVLVLEHSHNDNKLQATAVDLDVGVHLVGEVTRDDDFGRLLHH